MTYRILTYKEAAARRGESMSSFKREQKSDPDAPTPVDRGPCGKGILEPHDDAFQELKFLRKLWAQGKPVTKAIERCRAIIHGWDKYDDAA